MNTQTKSYDSAIIKKLEKAQVEITVSIPVTVWETHRAQALKNINESVTIDGFRKGMIPESVLAAKVGEMAILEEMAKLAISKAYLDIIIDNKIDAIGRPNVQMTKIAKGNPLELKIITAIVPEIILPNYREIARAEIVKQNPDEWKVTKEEIENTITSIRKERVPHKEIPTEVSDGEDHDHGERALSHDHHTASSGVDEETHLPELTDAFVKKLGAFDSVSDFRNKVSAMLSEQKVSEAREKRRLKIADEIISASTIELPEIMVESELARTEAQFKDDIGRMGVKLEDYLKHAKKTIEEIRVEWRPHAEKKAKLQLILNAIAEKEKLFAEEKDVEAEVKHILEHYKDADHERAHEYAHTVLTNEKVFQFLENTK